MGLCVQVNFKLLSKVCMLSVIYSDILSLEHFIRFLQFIN